MSTQPRVAIFRKEIYSLLRKLHLFHPLPSKVAHVIFEENGLEKPTQNLFNNISYYLLSIIDPQYQYFMTWPLYDTKAEREFRTELSVFINDYASKGLITEVRSSYLVHPSSYKVTILMHQLTVLAVKQTLIPRIKGTDKQEIFEEIENKYKNRSNNKSFVEYIKNLNYEKRVLDKLSDYLHKKSCCEKIAEMLRTKIILCERKLSKTQSYIDNLTDNFVQNHSVDELFKDEILKIKNINEPASIFDILLGELEKRLDIMEGAWDTKVLPIVEKCRNMYVMADEVIKRQTGEIPRSSYTLEYDPEKSAICTEEIQKELNSSQKYIFKNIVQNGRLSFPNLMRAFLICLNYILKDIKFGDDIYKLNEHVKYYNQEFGNAKAGFKALLERVDRAERKLQVVPTVVHIQSSPIDDQFQIPRLPDLSTLKMSQNMNHSNCATFTPLNVFKHQFNLQRRGEVFTRPQPRSVLTSYHAPKDDFLKKLLCIGSSYDIGNVSRSSDNISVISNIKANETIAGCSSGFTKQQIARLLSTKKKSSTKKIKKVGESHDKIKRGSLFDESIHVKDSSGLYRSYSSPNLLENRDKRSIAMNNIRGRKLSIMLEDNAKLDVSGIACLDSNFNTPTGFNAESSRNLSNFQKIGDDVQNQIDNVQRELEIMVSPILEQECHAKIVKPTKIPIINIMPLEHKQELCFSEAEIAREFQESHLKKEMPRTFVSHIPKLECNSSKTKTTLNSKMLARTSQERHVSELTTATKLSRISISPIIEHEFHSSNTVASRDLHESHSSKTVTPTIFVSPETHTIITPKPNNAIIKKTSSLEKIINRFKKVRANVMPLSEENEICNTNDDGINRNLLPDLLSLGERSVYVDSDTEDVPRNPRVSLGTMLGVDKTFLDQFDLSD